VLPLAGSGESGSRMDQSQAIKAVPKGLSLLISFYHFYFLDEKAPLSENPKEEVPINASDIQEKAPLSENPKEDVPINASNIQEKVSITDVQESGQAKPLIQDEQPKKRSLDIPDAVSFLYLFVFF